MPKFSQYGFRNASIGLLVILFIAMLGAVVFTLIDDDEPESHYAEMHMETNDQEHCADFIADEVGQDQIEVTVTNCGESAFRIRHGKARTKLNPDKDYSVRLPAGVDRFSATIKTLEGRFLGKFSF